MQTSPVRPVLAALALSVLLAGGCGGSGGDNNDPASKERGNTPAVGQGSTADVQQGGTLTISLNDPVDSLNPQTAVSLSSYEVFPNIFEGLLQTSPSGEVEPAIATKYDYSPDRRRLSFTLDRNAKFSNGDPLTSADVAFSVGVWQKGAYASSYASIKAVETPSPERVVLRLKQPAAGIVGALASTGASIFPKDYAGQSPEAFWKKPIGSGPFALTAVKLNQEIDMERNESYRVEGQPRFDAVKLRIVPDANQRLLQFQAGELDIVNRVAGDAAMQYPKDSVKSVLASTTDVIIANLKNPATESQALRQAISKAIDREALVKGAFGGAAVTPITVQPQIVPGVKACGGCDYATRDLTGAKALAGESGYDGTPIELLTSSTGGLELTAAQAMEPMLAEAGIKIKVVPVEQSVLLDRISSGDFALAATNYSATAPSPLDPLGLLQATSSLFSGADPEPLETALAAVAAARDNAGLEAATSTYEQAAYEEAALIPFAALKGNWAVNDEIVGFEPPALLTYSAGRLGRAK